MATLVVLLLHVPPDVPSVRFIVLPWQTTEGPPMAVAAAFTVTDVVTKHPPLTVYVTVVVPEVMPNIVPVLTLEDAVATAVLLLVHVPNETRSLSVVLEPAQSEVVPEIEEGAAFTVTIAAAVQPPTV